jgi:hypothetical protein
VTARDDAQIRPRGSGTQRVFCGFRLTGRVYHTLDGNKKPPQ